MNHVFIVLTEQRLRGGADAVPLLQLFAAAHGHPGALRRKALHMVLLLLEQAFRNEHRQVHVLVAGGLEALIHLVLDILPDGVTVGAVDEHTLDGGVVDQLRLFAHVGVPLGEIHLHIGDLLHLFLAGILSHNNPSFSKLLGVVVRIHCRGILCKSQDFRGSPSSVTASPCHLPPSRGKAWVRR